MKNFPILILICHFSLFCSCSSSSSIDVPKEIIANKVMGFDEYATDQFVVNVSDIMVKDDRVLFLDEGLSKVVVMNRDFEAPEFIGERGEGPGELMSPTHLFQAGDQIYVYDVKNLRIGALDFSENSIRNDMKLPFPIMKVNKSFIEQSILYFSTPLEPRVQIQKFDLNQGVLVEGIQLSDNVAQSLFGRNLFQVADGFIGVKAFDIPVIETYDQAWKLTNSQSLGEQPLIKKFLNFESPSGGLKVGSNNGSKPRPVGSGTLTIKCTVMEDSTMYLLVSTLGEDDKTRANTILMYKKITDTWQQSGSIRLPEAGNYSTFALQPEKNQLIAFNRISSTIEIFDIDE